MLKAQRENRPIVSTYSTNGVAVRNRAGDHTDNVSVKVLTDELLVTDFDPANELQRIRSMKQLGRRRPYAQGRSQLDAYTAELLALHDSGARPADLQAWLKMPPRRMTVAHSTVARWLRRTLDKRAADRERR